MPSTTPPIDPPYDDEDSQLQEEEEVEESYLEDEDATIHAAQHQASTSATASAGREPNPLLDPEAALVTPLEQSILDEYTRLLENMNNLATQIESLSQTPCAQTLDGLRLLERKTATVCTLLKASVYSIVLQQEIYADGDAEGAGQGGGNAGGNMAGMMGESILD